MTGFSLSKCPFSSTMFPLFFAPAKEKCAVGIHENKNDEEEEESTEDDERTSAEMGEESEEDESSDSSPTTPSAPTGPPSRVAPWREPPECSFCLPTPPSFFLSSPKSTSSKAIRRNSSADERNGSEKRGNHKRRRASWMKRDEKLDEEECHVKRASGENTRCASWTGNSPLSSQSFSFTFPIPARQRLCREGMRETKNEIENDERNRLPSTFVETVPKKCNVEKKGDRENMHVIDHVKPYDVQRGRKSPERCIESASSLQRMLWHETLLEEEHQRAKRSRERSTEEV